MRGKEENFQSPVPSQLQNTLPLVAAWVEDSRLCHQCVTSTRTLSPALAVNGGDELQGFGNPPSCDTQPQLRQAPNQASITPKLLHRSREQGCDLQAHNREESTWILHRVSPPGCIFASRLLLPFPGHSPRWLEQPAENFLKFPCLGKLLPPLEGSGSPGQSPPGSQEQGQAASLPVTWAVQSAAHLPGIRAHPALTLPFFCLLPPRFLGCSLATFVHLVT